MYDFHNSTDTLKFWTEKWAINKTFVFRPILMKLGGIVECIIGNYNFTKFHQNEMKNKKVLFIAHFSVQNFKVSVELWKSYIVGSGRYPKPEYYPKFRGEKGLWFFFWTRVSDMHYVRFSWFHWHFEILNRKTVY